MGIFFALLAAVLAALAYTSAKKSYEDFPPSIAFFLSMVFGLIIYVPFGLLSGLHFSGLPTTFLYAFVSAILAEAFYFYVLSKGELSITGTVIGTYPLFVILFSAFINHEHLSLVQGFFIGLTILGIIILSLPKKLKEKTLVKATRNGAILWALAGAIAVGLSDSLTKHAINQTSAGTFLFALAFAQIPVAIVYLFLEKQSLSQFAKIFHHFKNYQFAAYGGLLNIVNVLCLFLAFQFTLASIASPIGASYPSMMILFAVLFLKEKIAKKDLLGLVITIIGVIGISAL